MHRTTTTATLLVTVAVSALSGCVTVQLPASSKAPTAPSRPSAPRPDDDRPEDRPEPQIVQAPAREALELISPSDSPASTPPTRRGPAPDEPLSPAGKPKHHRPHPHPHPHPHHPDHPHPRRPDLHVPARPHNKVPEASAPGHKDAPGNKDVCALGRRYGGWRPDSPEASICQQTYGH